MLRIGICDDEDVILDILEKIVSRCLEQLGYEAEIIQFHSGRSLLEQSQPLNIVFLDLEMPELDGIETGRQLRRQQKDCKVIVATSRSDRFKEAFFIEAFRFVTKPFEESEIQEAIDAAVITLGGDKKIEVYQRRNKRVILQREIIYVRAVDSSVEFVLEEGIFRKETSLTTLEEELENKVFFRINRQCLVNITKIEQYDKGMVLIAGEKMKVSQRKRKDFGLRYREYMV